MKNGESTSWGNLEYKCTEQWASTVINAQKLPCMGRALRSPVGRIYAGTMSDLTWYIVKASVVVDHSPWSPEVSNIRDDVATAVLEKFVLR